MNSFCPLPVCTNTQKPLLVPRFSLSTTTHWGNQGKCSQPFQVQIDQGQLDMGESAITIRDGEN